MPGTQVKKKDKLYIVWVRVGGGRENIHLHKGHRRGLGELRFYGINIDTLFPSEANLVSTAKKYRAETISMSLNFNQQMVQDA